jgi:hypothetical protein
MSSATFETAWSSSAWPMACATCFTYAGPNSFHTSPALA